ncbi:hypothetical protein GmHk_11G033243 [Glycine max]|nr:hypothetical protein GmHk_11G033243 [Glycine max]
MEFAKPATIGRNNETPAIHTAVRMACDGREWRCHFCGLDRGEELYGGEDGITEREFVYGDVVRRWLTNYRLGPLFSLNSLLFANGRVLLHQQTRFYQILLLLRDGSLLTLFGCASFNLFWFWVGGFWSFGIM